MWRVYSVYLYSTVTYTSCCYLYRHAHTHAATLHCIRYTSSTYYLSIYTPYSSYAA